MTRLNVHPADVWEMVRHGNAIGTVYQAALVCYEHPSHITLLRLLRTKRLAREAGVDNRTIRETTQLAREAVRSWTR